MKKRIKSNILLTTKKPESWYFVTFTNGRKYFTKAQSALDARANALRFDGRSKISSCERISDKKYLQLIGEKK